MSSPLGPIRTPVSPPAPAAAEPKAQLVWVPPAQPAVQASGQAVLLPPPPPPAPKKAAVQEDSPSSAATSEEEHRRLPPTLGPNALKHTRKRGHRGGVKHRPKKNHHVPPPAPAPGFLSVAPEERGPLAVRLHPTLTGKPAAPFFCLIEDEGAPFEQKWCSSKETMTTRLNADHVDIWLVDLLQYTLVQPATFVRTYKFYHGGNPVVDHDIIPFYRCSIRVERAANNMHIMIKRERAREASYMAPVQLFLNDNDGQPIGTMFGAHAGVILPIAFTLSVPCKLHW